MMGLPKCRLNNKVSETRQVLLRPFYEELPTTRPVSCRYWLRSNSSRGEHFEKRENRKTIDNDKDLPCEMILIAALNGASTALCAKRR